MNSLDRLLDKLDRALDALDRIIDAEVSMRRRFFFGALGIACLIVAAFALAMALHGK